MRSKYGSTFTHSRGSALGNSHGRWRQVLFSLVLEQIDEGPQASEAVASCLSRLEPDRCVDNFMLIGTLDTTAAPGDLVD
jgi:hypothetical protein